MDPAVHATLAQAADASVPLHIIALSHELRVRGHIVALSDDSIAVEVGPDHPLAVLHTVSASFSLGTRTWSFLSSVIDAEEGTIVLSAPSELVWADRRLTARHPIDAAVEVEILGAHPAARPRLVDISLSGMGVTVQRATSLALGERVPVVIAYGDLRIEVTGELRRVNGNDLGFFFPDCVRRGKISPPVELITLMDRLSRP
jgi:hypothetical protein